MAYPVFRAPALDDLLREVYEDLLASGALTQPTRGDALERIGVQLELTKPRARLSRTETRGRVFSPLGEFCWYLAARNDAEFIQHYIAEYPGADDQGIMPGAYGPRIFGGGASSQFARVRGILATKPDSRQAVIQIFDRRDIETGQDDVPCTCTLQFLSRTGRLDLVVHMRSNDAFLGLPHDIFCFTMFQEIMARDLGLELGTYRHLVGSLHLYRRNERKAKEFIDEGWQSFSEMPAMPADPWAAIPQFLNAEAVIRERGELAPTELESLGAYWGDLARLLIVFRLAVRDRDPIAARRIAQDLGSPNYRVFVEEKLGGQT